MSNNVFYYSEILNRIVKSLIIYVIFLDKQLLIIYVIFLDKL